MISDDWEAFRSLAIAKTEGNKQLERQMKAWLRRLDYDISESDADITFVA